MINIVNKADCVGCNGCKQICPKKCINMIEDNQGFCYPEVNLSECIDCGLCETVCPVIHQQQSRKPMATYAAKNRDASIQQQSSSGGIFFALAKNIIENGGVVFGAKFNDEWEVVHDYTETIEGIKEFQRSKYVQSNIGACYIRVRRFLNDGRKVLFSGTPCQVAGLKLFLKKDYGDQLLTVDIVCHGVPSPGIWRTYMEDLLRRLGAVKNSDSQSTLYEEKPVITGINFRDKKLGWEKYGFSVHAVARQGDQNTDSQSTISKPKEEELFFEPHSQNLYMRGFLKDLYLRPSCYACPAKCGKSGSNITLADFWGISKIYPDLYMKNYISLLVIGDAKGEEELSKCNVNCESVECEVAISGNPAFETSALQPRLYQKFWSDYSHSGLSAIGKTVSSMRPSLSQRFINRASRLIKYIHQVKN